MTRSQKPYHRDTYANGVAPAVGDLIAEVNNPSRVAFVLKTSLLGYKHMAEVEWITGDIWGRASVSVGLFVKTEDKHV
jgi:hypothetical protein